MIHKDRKQIRILADEADFIISTNGCGMTRVIETYPFSNMARMKMKKVSDGYKLIDKYIVNDVIDRDDRTEDGKIEIIFTFEKS